MKAATLSFAAKIGLDAETRLQLAYHVCGFRMLHTYSRDAAAQPLLQLERDLAAVRSGEFRLDSTRSGKFVEAPYEVAADVPVAPVVDLTEAKVEETHISKEVPSSSPAESSGWTRRGVK